MSDHNQVEETNDQLVLIAGYSGTGKSASLRNIRNPERWLYMNTEAGKRLPFKSRFQQERITDPLDIEDIILEMIETDLGDDFDGAMIDSVNFMMDMYETIHVIGSANTQKAWGDYSQFFKRLMQQHFVKFNKPVIMTAHVFDVLDEQTQSMKTQVPVKGALSKTSVEAYFSTIVYARKMPVKLLDKYKSDLLNITEEERSLGYKHVFQTRITKDTVGDRIRSPMGLFTQEQTFMDNDVQVLLDHLHAFYN